MMNFHCKTHFLLSGLAIALAIAFFGFSISAAEHASVLEAVKSARSQGIDDETLDRLLAYSVDNTLGSEHTVRLVQLLVRIKKSGLSLVPFRAKLQEGAAKRVGPQKLEDALNQLFDSYKFIDDLLGHKLVTSEKHSNGEVVGMLVNSLNLGLAHQELRELIKDNPTVPPEMLAVAAQNKAFLKQIAFDRPLVDAILSTGLAKQNLTDDWSLFYRVAAASKKKGLSDDQIAKAAIDTLNQNGDLRQALIKLHFVMRDVRHGPHQNSPVDPTEAH